MDISKRFPLPIIAVALIVVVALFLLMFNQPETNETSDLPEVSEVTNTNDTTESNNTTDVSADDVSNEAPNATNSVETATSEEITETSQLNEITISHPVGWGGVIDPQGRILFGNVDIEVVLDGATPPDDAILGQIIVSGKNLLPPDAVDELDSESILMALSPDGDATEVTIIERDTNDNREPIAFINQSDAQTDAHIYAKVINDNTFALIPLSAPAGLITEQSELIEAIIDTMTIEFQVDATGAGEMYTDIEFGVTEEGFPRLGSADASVVVYEISSFDCPHCKTFHDNVLPEILTRVGDDVAFVYVPIFGSGGIPAGDMAARASLCAGEQDMFWAYHDLIFAAQEFATLAFADGRLDLIAESLSLDVGTFQECMMGDSTTSTLEAARDFAGSFEDFRGTPSVYINGILVPSGAVEINAAIDELLDS